MRLTDFAPVSLLALVPAALLAGCLEVDGDGDDAADQAALEEVEQVEQATTSACWSSVVRRQLEGTVSTAVTTELANQSGAMNTSTAYKKRCTTSFSMAVGDRHLVKLVGANGGGSANPASAWVERYGTSWVKVKSKSTAGTSTEVLDWSVDVAGTYRVCAVADDTTEAGSDYVRFTSDKSSPAACGAVGTRVDYCFGASGSNCDGVYLVSACTTKSNAKVDCQVSVGSNLHDTCCSHNPGGYNCGGTGNPSGWGSDCRSEYDHAYNDVGASRKWTRTMDPTEHVYRPNDSRTATTVDKTGDFAQWSSLSTYDNRHRGTPTVNSFKAPAGQGLWDVDAVNGWCASGSYGAATWSLQGTYRVCN